MNLLVLTAQSLLLVSYLLFFAVIATNIRLGYKYSDWLMSVSGFLMYAMVVSLLLTMLVVLVLILVIVFVAATTHVFAG